MERERDRGDDRDDRRRRSDRDEDDSGDRRGGGGFGRGRRRDGDEDEEGEGGRGPGGKMRRRRGFGRKRPCRNCTFIDFKDMHVIQRYTTQSGKIQGRKRNGTCAKCQNNVKTAVKRARLMALMPFVG